MYGTVLKVHAPKVGRNGIVFITVEFSMEDGSWAKTSICPTFRNFDKWKDIMIVGMKLKNLRIRKPKEVDADSMPIPEI